MEEYITQAGDQWDAIAKRIYGNELLADALMEQNPHLLDIYAFDAGTVIRYAAQTGTTDEALPQWRR